MKFRIETWTIKKLVEAYNNKNLDLNPAYQRRFIWSINDQQTLIDSILRGFAIPNIFLYERGVDRFEMVDGQQRTRTILGFINKQFKTFEKQTYSPEAFDKKLMGYKFAVIIIEEIEEDENIEDFYALVNKAGIHLNRPELKKAEYFETNFLKLVTELAELKDFSELNLFTEGSEKRMIDVDFVSELVTFLIEGNTDKKIKVDKAFEDDISLSQFASLKKSFKTVINIFTSWNKIELISNTRYKQRNDFYTLFGFVHQNISLKESSLIYFYRLLVEFSDDITPSNDKCEPFQEYTFHCISQSNSKNARDARLTILNEIFLNPEAKPNKTQKSILKYYGAKTTNENLKKVEKFHCINIDSIT